MEVGIFRIDLGFDQCYVLKSDGVIVVDPGSVSVLLDAGEAFVGDLAMNRFPLRFFPGLPIFADDLDAVTASWQLLLAQGARTVYPAHGKPFPAEVIQRALS